MDPVAKLAALNAEAAALRTKALGSPESFTEADGARATEIAKERTEVSALIERAKSAAEALGFAADEAPLVSSDEQAPAGNRRAKAMTLGEAFVNSDVYKSHQKENPNGASKGTDIRLKASGLGIRKVDPAPVSSGTQGNSRAVRTNEVDDLVNRPERRLLDLITTGTTNLPWFQYRQIISKTNNAALVNEAVTSTGTTPATGLKPLSTLTTQTAEAKAYTYADGMEVTNQELADDGIMKALIDSTLRENLEILTESILLNGAGTADEPAGILNTSGVLQQAFVTDVPTTIRKAITKLRTTSGTTIRGVLLHPEDDETWDLLKDTQGRFLGNGPFAGGPKTAWSYERIDSQALEVGQAIVGDFSTIHLLDLDALAIEAFNQHKDYAQHNLVYVRAEQRKVQLIRNAARLCVVDLTAG
ncbi:phage major capsid protein [Arthrobacter sp. UYCu712]|uniref:phage major capsid protein n=1 Tax=Arthrobacter sp. UYCu712 TaxID=3156340 RepID=UPI003395F4FF